MAKEDSSGQEKTEQPTSKRRNKARQEGQVAKSQEINLVVGLMAAVIYFVLRGPAMVKSIRVLFRRLFTDYFSMRLTPETTVRILNDLVNDMMEIILPFMVILVIAALMANIFQIGFLFTLKPFKPRLDKFNPIKGIKRLFSPKKLVEVLKDVFKILIIGVVPYIIIKGELDRLPLIMDMHVWAILSYIGTLILKIVFYTGLVMLILAILDYSYQKWNHEKDLKMTKQEVKDEIKQSEGDPKIRARIRHLQFEFLRKLMMQEVPKADVVITNPMHIAVALKYERTKMDAPRVVAKGVRLIAEKIKKLAHEHNVPIVENKPLAQSLYKMVEVGDTVPETLYKAVAEVLAYVYSRKNKDHAAAH